MAAFTIQNRFDQEIDDTKKSGENPLLKLKERTFDYNKEVLNSKLLEQRVKTWKYVAEKLWSIIDDIDTYSDMAKGDNYLYRHLVERKQCKRFDYLDSDGYDLFPTKKMLSIAKKIKKLVKG